MIFRKLILKNFASYYENIEFNFQTSPDKPIAIIVGSNGFGKTSFFDAINWALFGKEYIKSLKGGETQKSLDDFVNETALTNSKSSKKPVEMSVVLYFDHEDISYYVQRFYHVFPDGPENEFQEKHGAYLYEISATGDHRLIPHFESFLGEIIPYNVRDYFLFDGERIRDLSLPGSSEKIRNAIYRVVDLELLQNGVRHLKEIAKSYGKKAEKSSTGEMANLEAAFRVKRDHIDYLKNKNSENEKERNACEDLKLLLEDQLRNLDGSDELQTKRDFIVEGIKDINEQLKSVLYDLRGKTALMSMSIISDEAKELLENLNIKKGKGEIPTRISENLISEILEMEICICGRGFENGDETYKNLQIRKEQEKKKKQIGEGLLELYFELKDAINEIEQSKAILDELDKRRSKLFSKKIEKEILLKEIQQKLMDSPNINVKEIAENYTDVTNKISEIKIEIEKTNRFIAEEQKNLIELGKGRDMLGKKQEKVHKFQMRDKLAQKSAEELEKIFLKYSEIARNEVQNNTSILFKSMIPSANSLKVNINNEFQYDIRDQNDRPALEQLSQGQKQLLSLSFISSIIKTSGKQPPMVIDMPLGRLALEVQESAVEKVPSFSSQIILLVLPGTEWRPEIKQKISNKISDIYHLSFDSRKRQTTISRIE